jgi:hypothetical protein
MEWTPNELADALRNWIGNKDQLLAAANMLQNQAQEIEHLKEVLGKIIVISDRKHDAWDQAKDLLKKDMK